MTKTFRVSLAGTALSLYGVAFVPFLTSCSMQCDSAKVASTRSESQSAPRKRAICFKVSGPSGSEALVGEALLTSLDGKIIDYYSGPESSILPFVVTEEIDEAVLIARGFRAKQVTIPYEQIVSEALTQGLRVSLTVDGMPPKNWTQLALYSQLDLLDSQMVNFGFPVELVDLSVSIEFDIYGTGTGFASVPGRYSLRHWYFFVVDGKKGREGGTPQLTPLVLEVSEEGLTTVIRAPDELRTAIRERRFLRGRDKR